MELKRFANSNAILQGDIYEDMHNNIINIIFLVDN